MKTNTGDENKGINDNISTGEEIKGIKDNIWISIKFKVGKNFRLNNLFISFSGFNFHDNTLKVLQFKFHQFDHSIPLISYIIFAH